MNIEGIHLKDPYKKTIILVLFIIAFFPTLLWMSKRWFAQDSYYGHGILVPMVSFFIIYKKREILSKISFEKSKFSFIFFVVSIICFWISSLLHVYFFADLSLLAVIYSLVLHFYGKKIFKELLFPLAFLFFMIPLPLIVVAFVCFKLKIIAAHLATLILNIIGLPAVQQSSIIKMAHSYVLVEDSCGGLRSLVSLTALGSIFAYQLNSNLLRKSLLFLSAIPIATITNACRIVFLSAVGEIWGSKYTQDPLHSISGYLVFAFAFILLFAVKNLLKIKYVK